jgi:hypothetical protein
MWINKKQYDAHLDLLHRTIRDLQERLTEANTARLLAVQRTERALEIKERAVTSAAAAKAYYDLARTQNNELKLERAALLARLLPGLTLAVATVRTGIVEPPGASLEDMGDAAASVFADAALMPEDPEAYRSADPDQIQGAQIFADPEELLEGLGGTVVRSPVGA